MRPQRVQLRLDLRGYHALNGEASGEQKRLLTLSLGRAAASVEGANVVVDVRQDDNVGAKS